MKALIDSSDPRETGYRVAQVESNETFKADMPLFWVDCSDNIVADQYWYNPTTQQFVKFTQPVVEQPQTTGTQDL